MTTHPLIESTKTEAERAKAWKKKLRALRPQIALVKSKNGDLSASRPQPLVTRKIIILKNHKCPWCGEQVGYCRVANAKGEPPEA